MKAFFRLLSFAKPWHRFWPKYLLFIILGLIFGIANFALIIPVLNVMFTPQDVTPVTELPEFSLTIAFFKTTFYYYLYKMISQHSVQAALMYVCIVLAVASFFANWMKYLGQRALAKMRTYVIYNLRKTLYDKISRLHIGYFHDQRKGNILSIVSNDVSEVQNCITYSFQIILREPILIIGYLMVLLYMSVQLTVITLVAIPASGFLISRLSRRLRRNAGEAQTLLGSLTSTFEETISGARIIKAFNAQHYVRRQFDKVNERQRAILRKVMTRQELASPLSEFLGVFVAASVLFYGGLMQATGHLNMSGYEFIAYIGFYYLILVPVKNLSNAYTNLQRGMAAGDRVFAIIDMPVDIKKSDDSVPVNEFKQQIEYRNVSFAYKQEPVLRNVSLTIEKGKMIALVGLSGAGKSTFADLLPRFYDVSGGEILLDGIDIRKYEPKDLIGLMGIVTQEAILFNDTVFNNIAFGIENAEEEAVIQAAKVANAHEFIMEMEQGYHTNIGDRGVKLSGGQRQRLSIARAVFKNPPILILDEATSALDTESERLVQDALTRLMENRTSLVIAHRLSTIRHADKIVVLQKGEIKETGTHDELMAKNGIYQRLCELQAFN